MAKKTETKAAKKKELTPQQKQKKKDKKEDAKADKSTADTINRERTEDEARAKSKAEEYYGPGSLGRLGDTGTLPPPENVGEVSTVMEGGTQNIADAEQAYQRSQIRDAFVKDALTKMQAGLGGFSPEEMQAYEAQALRPVRSGTATATRQLRAAGGEAGVTGSAATRALMGLLQGDQTARAQVGTNLATMQVQEKGRRLGEYANTAQSSANSLQSAQQQALATLLGARTNVADYTLKAQGMNQGAQQNNISNRFQYDTYNLNRARDLAVYNLGQEEKEKAGYLGAYYGEQGVDQARRADVEGRNLIRRQIRAAERGVG